MKWSFKNIWFFLKELKVLFQQFDIDKSGDISLDEFLECVDSMGFHIDDQLKYYFFETEKEKLNFKGKSLNFSSIFQVKEF